MSTFFLRPRGSQPRFDYRGKHRYLITLPVFSSRKVFTDTKTVLAVLDVLRAACWEHHFDVYAYCFLPDQLIMIVRGRSHQSDMKAFLTTFREQSSGAIRSYLSGTLWARSYLERVLRKEEESGRVAKEIFQRPVHAGLAHRPGDYPFQGSFVRAEPPRSPSDRSGRSAANRKP